MSPSAHLACVLPQVGVGSCPFPPPPWRGAGGWVLAGHAGQKEHLPRSPIVCLFVRRGLVSLRSLGLRPAAGGSGVMPFSTPSLEGGRGVRECRHPRPRYRPGQQPQKRPAAGGSGVMPFSTPSLEGGRGVGLSRSCRTKRTPAAVTHCLPFPQPILISKTTHPARISPLFLAGFV